MRNQSLLLAIAMLLACRREPTRSVEQLSPALQGLVTHAEAYAQLRKRVEAQLPPLAPTSDPAKIEEHKDAFVGALRAARPAVRRGDVIDPQAAEELRRIVRRSPRPEMAGSAGAGEPRVNDLYPETRPLATMPPQLLEALPPLPSALEFRIIGNALVLLDRETRLIVDLVPDVLPP